MTYENGFGDTTILHSSLHSRIARSNDDYVTAAGSSFFCWGRTIIKNNRS